MILPFRRALGIVYLTFLLALWTTPLKAAATSQPSGPTLPPNVVRLADIRYGDGPGKSNLLDLYEPTKADHARPLIIWIHGGGWSAGDKSGCPAVTAVDFGFVVASLNYRLSGQAPYPAQIQDCKGAIRFLRAHAGQYHIDPNEIGVWGASAGGHLVALLGTSAGSSELEGTVGGNLDQPSRVQAVCDWFGPTDLTKFADQAQAAGIMKTTPGPALITKLFGGSLQDKKDLFRESNPIGFIAGQTNLPPFLIMHGDQDKLVPVAQSQMLYDALKSTGASVQLQVIPGAGHGIGFSTPAIASTVLTFFKSNLK